MPGETINLHKEARLEAETYKWVFEAVLEDPEWKKKTLHDGTDNVYQVKRDIALPYQGVENDGTTARPREMKSNQLITDKCPADSDTKFNLAEFYLADFAGPLQRLEQLTKNAKRWMSGGMPFSRQLIVKSSGDLEKSMVLVSKGAFDEFHKDSTWPRHETDQVALETDPRFTTNPYKDAIQDKPIDIHGLTLAKTKDGTQDTYLNWKDFSRYATKDELFATILRVDGKTLICDIYEKKNDLMFYSTITVRL